MIDKDGFAVDDFRKHYYYTGDPNYPLRYASEDSTIDWQDFKDCITDNYEYQLEENKFDMHGIYNPWDNNPFKSDLGLEGKTK